MDLQTISKAVNGISPNDDSVCGVEYAHISRAPDGTCLLVASADCKVRLYNLPSELYSGPVNTQLPEMVGITVEVGMMILFCVESCTGPQPRRDSV